MPICEMDEKTQNKFNEICRDFDGFNLDSKLTIITKLEQHFRCCEVEETSYLNLVSCFKCGKGLCEQTHGTYCSHEKALKIGAAIYSCYNCQSEVFGALYCNKQISRVIQMVIPKHIEQFLEKFDNSNSAHHQALFFRLEESCRCIDNYSDLPNLNLMACYKCKKLCCHRPHTCKKSYIIDLADCTGTEIHPVCECAGDFIKCPTCEKKSDHIKLCPTHSQVVFPPPPSGVANFVHRTPAELCALWKSTS